MIEEGPCVSSHGPLEAMLDVRVEILDGTNLAVGKDEVVVVRKEICKQCPCIAPAAISALCASSSTDGTVEPQVQAPRLELGRTVCKLAQSAVSEVDVIV